MVRDKIKEAGNLIWQWVLLILLPPITLIITVEFAKLLFQFGIIWGLLMIIVGIVAEIIEILNLINKTKEVIS